MVFLNILLQIILSLHVFGDLTLARSNDSNSIMLAQHPGTTSHLSLDYLNRDSAQNNELVLSNIQSTPELFVTLSVITVKGYSSLCNQTQLDDVLQRLPPPLNEFHFEMNTPIPSSTLKALEQNHPSVRLYYTMPFSYWDRYDENVPSIQGAGEEPNRRNRMRQRRNILNWPNLYSLRADIEYGAYDNYEDLELVWNILTSCPNLRELELSLSRSGCVVANYPYAFDFTRNSLLLPPLESLRLHGYNLNKHTNGVRQGYHDINRHEHLLPPWSWLPRFLTDRLYWTIEFWEGVNRTARDEDIRDSRIKEHLARQQVEPHNLNAWIDRMDWSNLKHLELDEVTPKILQRLSPVIPSVEHLSFGPSLELAADMLPSFLRNLTNPLKHLSLYNIDFAQYGDLISALSSEAGKALNTLVLTESESSRHRYCTSDWSEENCSVWNGQYYLPRPFLNESHLEQLSKQSPDISHLEIDVQRVIPNASDSSTWYLDHETINAAAQLPNLSNLTINVESPDHVRVRLLGASNYRYSSVGTFLEPFRGDPNINRTSFPALFASINSIRIEMSLPPLQHLEVKVGLWSARDQDWGMGGPPDLLIGDWICRSTEADEGVCFGGNERLGENSWHGKTQLQDRHSEDWTLPDKFDSANMLWDEEEEELHWLQEEMMM